MNARYASAALAASTLLVSILAAAPAWADPVQGNDDATQKAAVSFNDLNLNTAEGQAVLAARIHRAAEAVCGPTPDSRDLQQLQPYRRCMKQSLDAALAAIPSPSQLAGKVKPAG